MGFLRFAQEDTACLEWIQANGAQVCLSVQGQWTLPRPPIITIITIQIAAVLSSCTPVTSSYLTTKLPVECYMTSFTEENPPPPAGSRN